MYPASPWTGAYEPAFRSHPSCTVRVDQHDSDRPVGHWKIAEASDLSSSPTCRSPNKPLSQTIFPLSSPIGTSASHYVRSPRSHGTIEAEASPLVIIPVSALIRVSTGASHLLIPRSQTKASRGVSGSSAPTDDDDESWVGQEEERVVRF